MTFESVPRSYEKSRAWRGVTPLRSVPKVQTRAQRRRLVKGNTLQEASQTNLPTYRIGLDITGFRYAHSGSP